MPGFMKGLLSNRSSSQRCPSCDGLIAADAINIKEGVALCAGCGKLSRLSELNTSGRSMDEILCSPPPRCYINSDSQRVTVTVSLRSLPGFFFPAGFALFWNGITSVFVLQAIAGLWANLVGPVPEWFPSPGLKGGKPEMNGGPMELGMTLFLCIFLIPFVTIGMVMVGVALMNLIGKTEVVIDEIDSYLSTGVGFIRWKRRFDPRAVHAVDFGSTAWQSESGNTKLIEIKADKSVKFGSMLQSPQMEWVRVVLVKTLLPDQGTSPLPHLSWLRR